MDYLPVCLKLERSPVLLVGGGTVATRKARLLQRAGARMTVVAPDISRELEQMLADGGGIWRQARYTQSDLDDQSLVIAATPDGAVNLQVHPPAVARNLPVNVVD